MNHDRLSRARARFGATSISHALVGVLLCSVYFPVSSQAQDSVQGVPVSRLEAAFWVCDHAVSQRRLGTRDSMACTVVTEALKAVKFDGDFQAFLEWWRQERADAHAALETADQLAVDQLAVDRFAAGQ